MDTSVKGIRIDWHAGVWRLWDIGCGFKHAEGTSVTLIGTVVLENTDNNKRGYAITNGTIERQGERLIVRSVTNG